MKEIKLGAAMQRKICHKCKWRNKSVSGAILCSQPRCAYICIHADKKKIKLYNRYTNKVIEMERQ